ncbi:PIN-like domain-containing protein [Rhodococcus qingshengii]|uniref:PIN-like domain-containing protein n=1 Tax=Rhodococcus qingshengii TaxID=334542 RepID=UPI0021096DD8|nr:PIN-like domain-containing protein [Rhodococcus qingshengii]MCQ4148602.1 PIN domain-containing protein [Rhodococcus qingshengii]
MMRAEFPEWYPLADDELARTITDGTIAVDTNVLHQLYRLGTEQRNEVLGVLRNPAVRDRIWVPHQVALEYQRNRLKVGRDQGHAYDAVTTEIATATNKLSEVINQNIRDKKIRDQIKEAVHQALAPVSALVTELRGEHVIDADTLRTSDPIRAALDKLLDKPHRIGPKPDEKVIEDRIKDSVARYDKDIPPGYADAKAKKPKDNPEGDYLIWCEILDHAEANQRPLLFVTNDTKEDWYQLDDRIPVAPRIELKREIATKTKHPYHQLTLEQFLRLANEHLGTETSDATLTTVGQLVELVPSDRDSDVVRTLRGAITKNDLLKADNDSLYNLLAGTFDSSSASPALRRDVRKTLADLHSDWPSAMEVRAAQRRAIDLLITILESDDPDVFDNLRAAAHDSRPLDFSWMDGNTTWQSLEDG